MENFTQALVLSSYTLYMQDYGGLVGFRMAMAHPERIEALIERRFTQRRARRELEDAARLLGGPRG